MKELLANIREIVDELGCDDDDDLLLMLKDVEEESRKSSPGLFKKDGNFSITRTILVASWAMGMCLYVFGSLFAGAVIPVIQATIPAFDSAAFLAVTGAASSLYFANHNIRIGRKPE